MRRIDLITWYGMTCHWMITDHKYDKVEYVSVAVLSEFREFIRPIKDWLKDDMLVNGLKEPIMLIYNQNTRKVYVGEGNHRIAIARRVGIELLPVRVVRTTYGDKGKVVKGVDPNEYGYVKGSLYPSEIGLETYSLDELCI
jgi:hypothetical protein